MIGCMQTWVRKKPITALYFESENELKFYNLEARCPKCPDFTQSPLDRASSVLVLILTVPVNGFFSHVGTDISL